MIEELDRLLSPYIDNDLVKDTNHVTLSRLVDPKMDEIIRSVDLIIRGLRRNQMRDKSTRRNAGNFSSSIMISRGWLFLDYAHFTNDVETIIGKIYDNTATGERSRIVRDIRDKTTQRLLNNGLIEFDSSNKKVIDVMPYPISSKIFVLKELIDKPRLFNEQKNHFKILGKVQYFPELKNNIKKDSANHKTFERDYKALYDIDVIKERMIKGREYTLAKAYLLDNSKSLDIWKSVLETSDRTRAGLKDLMEILGQLGGFLSLSEISSMTQMSPRLVSKLIRNTDTIGLAQRARTLSFEDALSRPIETKIPLNYHQLNNSQAMLTVCRSVPEAIDMVTKLRVKKSILEDDLLEEGFDATSVTIVRNALSEIGIITKDGLERDDYLWNMIPDKDAEDFLLELESVSLGSRRIYEEDTRRDKSLLDFGKVDETGLSDTLKKVDQDLWEEVSKEAKS